MEKPSLHIALFGEAGPHPNSDYVAWNLIECRTK
jgi:hypothetical protein